MDTILLLGVPASHPCAAVEAALRLKGLAYRRIDFPPVLHKPVMRVAFGRGTVPAVRFPDRHRIVGSRAIVRALDVLAPEPPLLTGAPDVEAADAWGDEVLQPLARRLAWSELSRHPDALHSYVAGARPPVPALATRVFGRAIVRAELAIHGTRPADRADLDGCLDRVDAWIAAGTLGGQQPNAADLQIGSSVRLLLTVGELAARIDGRPAGAHARRFFPDYPGRVDGPPSRSRR